MAEKKTARAKAPAVKVVELPAPPRSETIVGKIEHEGPITLFHMTGDEFELVGFIAPDDGLSITVTYTPRGIQE